MVKNDYLTILYSTMGSTDTAGPSIKNQIVHLLSLRIFGQEQRPALQELKRGETEFEMNRIIKDKAANCVSLG